MNQNNNKTIRINKFISNSGGCSRSQADELIVGGKVKVNGKLFKKLGAKIKLSDKVTVRDKEINHEKKIYLLLNKPKNYITTNEDTHGRKIVFDLIKGIKERVFSVGRLDRNSTGLLLITNDGGLSEKINHPKYKMKKIYEVKIDKPLKKRDLKSIEKGIVLDNEKIVVDNIVILDKNNQEIGIEIHIGKNRIIRKVFNYFNYKVNKLDRVMIGPLTKKNLPRGKFRHLKPSEVRLLY